LLIIRIAFLWHPASAPKADLGPSPRLCYVRKWPDFQGYGFNLHAEKGKPGQFLGSVDEKSPADYAGLRKGDRIIEVNGANVTDETHTEVVQRIKTNPQEVRLLVVDSPTEAYYRERQITIRSDMPNVERFECPAVNPGK